MTGGVALRCTLLLLPMLTGCASVQEAPKPRVAQVEVTEDLVPLEWRTVATPADQERLTHLGEAWTRGLAAAGRYRSATAAAGPLLEPAAGLPRAAPSPGPYLCRVVKLGGHPAIAAFRPFNCFVEAEGDLLTMVKANGTQRPAGRLWVDSDSRLVFLGALGRPGEAVRAYGDDDARNVAGYLERIGPFRWRLAVPYPQGGGVLDLYELTPLIPAAS